MKKLIVSLCLLFVLVPCVKADIVIPSVGNDSGITIPVANDVSMFQLQDSIKPSVCGFYDCINGVSGTGSVIPVLSIYNTVDFNVGGGTFENSKTAIASLSFDLDKLQEHNVNITYLWQNLVKTTISLWVGYDTENKKTRVGVSATIIQVKF